MQTRQKPQPVTSAPPTSQGSGGAGVNPEDRKKSKTQGLGALNGPDSHVATRSQGKSSGNGATAVLTAAEREKEEILNDLMQLREGPPLSRQLESNNQALDNLDKYTLPLFLVPQNTGGSAGNAPSAAAATGTGFTSIGGNSTIIIGGSGIGGGFSDPKKKPQPSAFAAAGQSSQTASSKQKGTNAATTTPLKKGTTTNPTVTAVIKKQGGSAAGAGSGGGLNSGGTSAVKGKSGGLNSITIPNGQALAGTKRARDDGLLDDQSYNNGAGGGGTIQLDGGASYDAGSHIDGDERLYLTGKPVGMVVLASSGIGGGVGGGGSSDKNEESKVLSTTSKKVTPTTQVVAAAASQQNKRPKVTSVKVTTQNSSAVKGGGGGGGAASAQVAPGNQPKSNKSGQKGGQPQLTKNNLDEFNKANPGGAAEMASVNNGDLFEILSEDGQQAVQDLLKLFIRTYTSAVAANNNLDIRGAPQQQLPQGSDFQQQKPGTSSANKKAMGQGDQVLGASINIDKAPGKGSAFVGATIKKEDSVTIGSAGVAASQDVKQGVAAGGFGDNLSTGKRNPTPQEIEAALQNLQGATAAAQGEYAQVNPSGNPSYNQDAASAALANNALARLTQEQQRQLLVDPGLAGIEQQRYLQQQLALCELLQHPDILAGNHHPQELLAILQQYGISDQSILQSSPLIDLLLKSQMGAPPGAPSAADAAQQPQYAYINGNLHQINPYAAYPPGTAIVAAGGAEFLAATQGANGLAPQGQHPIQFKTPKYSHVSIAYMIKERQTALRFQLQQQQQQQQHQNEQQAQAQLQQQQQQQQQQLQQQNAQQSQSTQLQQNNNGQQPYAQSQSTQPQDQQINPGGLQQSQQQVNGAQGQSQQHSLAQQQEINLDDPATALAYQQALQQQQNFQRLAGGGAQQVYIQGGPGASSMPAGYGAISQEEQVALEAMIQDQRIAQELTQILSSLDPRQQIAFIEEQIQQNPGLQNVLIRVYQQLQGGALNAQPAQHYIEPSTGQIIDQYQLLALQQQQAQVQVQVQAHLAQIVSLLPGFDSLSFQQQQALISQSLQAGNSGPIAIAIEQALIEYHQLRQQH